MRHGSLFSGIGGFDLAAQWVGWENVFQVEWDTYCQKVLTKNFPNVKRYGDIREFDGTVYAGTIDIISGGFPCQPFSHAGKRKGTSDDRFLWPEMLRVIREVKPSFVVGENVAGLVSMENGKTLDRILSDLANEGYQTEQFIIPACAVGAWHRRDRIWILAYSDVARQWGIERQKEVKKTDIPDTNSGRLQKPGAKQQASRVRQLHEVISNSTTIGLQRSQQENGSEREKCNDKQPYGCNREWNEPWEQWSIEPAVGRRFNGLPLWLYRHTIKGYGQTESYRRIEILRELWATIPTQVLWQVIGGFNQIQKSEVLFAIVCEYEARPNETRLLLASKKTLKEFVRGLWMRGEITGSSYRPDKGEQSTGEHSDSMQTLSRLLAHNLQENWQVSSWEDGIPRVANGVKNRVDRLKGLGNAIVPWVVFEIFKAIDQIKNNL